MSRRDENRPEDGMIRVQIVTVTVEASDPLRAAEAVAAALPAVTAAHESKPLSEPLQAKTSHSEQLETEATRHVGAALDRANKPRRKRATGKRTKGANAPKPVTIVEARGRFVSAIAWFARNGSVIVKVAKNAVALWNAFTRD